MYGLKTRRPRPTNLCRKRGWHLGVDCEYDKQPVSSPKKFKKLRSGLLNTRERDAPALQKAIMKRNSTACPILTLPPEIRNRIYDLVLGGQWLWIGYAPHERIFKTTKGNRQRTHIPGGLYHRGNLDRKLQLGFLRVCRQTYAEAALLPYALNQFVFENDWVYRKFEKCTRPAQQRAVGKFKIWSLEKFKACTRPAQGNEDDAYKSKRQNVQKRAVGKVPSYR